MILYLSGNFPQLASPEKELKMAQDNEKRGIEYRRLMTFYYPEHCKIIMNTRKKIHTTRPRIKLNRRLYED